MDFSEAVDIGGQSADNRDFTIDLYYPLCVSRRIDTWQIVYLSYKDPCPTISISIIAFSNLTKQSGKSARGRHASLRNLQ